MANFAHFSTLWAYGAVNDTAVCIYYYGKFVRTAYIEKSGKHDKNADYHLSKTKPTRNNVTTTPCKHISCNNDELHPPKTS